MYELLCQREFVSHSLYSLFHRYGFKIVGRNGGKPKKFGEAVREWPNTVSTERWLDTPNNWEK